MIPKHNIDVVRGDNFELFVGLARGWEGIADPIHGRLVFRDAQDDDLSDHIALTSILHPTTDGNFPEMSKMLIFEAAPADTQGLPDWPLVCFCELTDGGSFVKRLFNGRVKVTD